LPNTSASGGFLLPTNIQPASDFDIDRQLNVFIAGTAGLPGSLVRPRWQPEPPTIPAPSVDWIAFGKTKEEKQPGSPYIRHVPIDESDPNDVGQDRLFHIGYLHYLVSFYGPNCEKIAGIVSDGLDVNQNHEVLDPLGLRLRYTGDQILIPEQVNKVWYRRVDMELMFEHTYVREYAVQNIIEALGEIHTQRPQPDGEIVSVDWDTERIIR